MYIGSDGFTTLVTGSVDKKILKPITGRLKAYSMLFLPLLERHDLLLYRNPFHVSFLILIVIGEISVPLRSDNYMTGLSQTTTKGNISEVQEEK